MSRNTRSPSSQIRAFVGKYVLDSLSFGMYDHPLMALREYVQNSADAIDGVVGLEIGPLEGKGLVTITVDGRRRSLEIRDNGTGIPAERAWHVLHDLGRSEKDPSKSRGFRGIGRLGGLGYSQTLTFTTKARGEDVVSTVTWDCQKLRRLVGGKADRNVASIIRQVATFAQYGHEGDDEDHFFAVQMDNVRSSRDALLNVPAIKAYLSQVAPVPFDRAAFRFAEEIDETLRESVPSYDTYCIRVNGEPVCKPYSDRIGINQHGPEEIGGIQFFRLLSDTDSLALGWLAELELRGTIWPSSHVDGLRLRSGNIQIGEKETLSRLFREKRFANYLTGEVHLLDARLAPNSRRDELEDSALRETLHSCFIRDIGIPYSRRIRALSVERSRSRIRRGAPSLQSRVDRVIKHGYAAESQKHDLLQKLRELNGARPDDCTEEDVNNLIRAVRNSQHVLGSRGALSGISRPDLAKRVCEVIYRESVDKVQAEALIEKIAAELYH